MHVKFNNKNNLKEVLTLFIVSYNSSEILMNCMDTLLKSDKFNIVIVDNNSSDGSSKKLIDRYPHIDVISLDKNLGYGRAANIALSKITTPYAFLLNPDLCLTPELIIEFYETVCESSQVATAYAPAVRDNDYSTSLYYYEPDWILGAAMLFNMEQLKKVGFFDENIFLFYEEKDLCHRIRAAGQRLLLFPGISFKHLKGQGSLPDKKIIKLKNWHIGWSSMYFLRKHQLAFGKRSAHRLLFRYWIKGYFSFAKEKRDKFQMRRKGILAFLQGQKAFGENGRPYWP